jgi:EAL domain-containing protein (putative c-di-GMP-specific phosphodiesterase class I)
MSSRARLLGFAFANADFLFEIDGAGTIQFAAGAANDLVREGSEALIGRPAGRLFQAFEQVRFRDLVQALKSGMRAGPFSLVLTSGEQAQLSMLRLAENGASICCTLMRQSPSQMGPSRMNPPEASPADDAGSGLKPRAAFLAQAAELLGPDDALTLLDVPGLAELCAGLSPEQAQALSATIGVSFQKAGAVASARLSESRFGAISPARLGLDLGKLLGAALSGAGLKSPAVRETKIGLQGPGLSPEQRLLAVRFVVDRFADKGRIDAKDGDIASGFTAMLEDTQKRLARITQTTADGAFDIAYQPISSLATGKVSHYEALARFANQEGTADTVKFIEALGIANAFDIAVANKVLEVVARDARPHVHVAFNISGATLASPASFGLLAGLLAKRRALAPRLLIEVTETSAIADLESAGKAIAVLREMGYRVGLDDFGAGAASVNYLHALPVDFVKFDGAMIQKIGQSPRDDAVLSGLARLCEEMGLETIAEWIENEAMARAALALGFGLGQGRFLGAPLLEIPADGVAPGKRKGVQESWG